MLLPILSYSISRKGRMGSKVNNLLILLEPYLGDIMPLPKEMNAPSKCFEGQFVNFTNRVK